MLKSIITFSVISSFLFTVSLKAYSQTVWAPIGAKWVIEENENEQSKQIFTTFKSVKDTIVQGKFCKKIETNNHIEIRNYKEPPTNFYDVTGCFFIYSENDKVYYSKGDSFLLLYDFSLSPGDTFSVYQLNMYPKDTLMLNRYIIDSIDYIQVSGKMLKRQYLHSIDSILWHFIYRYSFDGYIIEKIGHFRYLFGYYWEPFDNVPPYLKCYTDSKISYEHAPSSNCNGYDGISENIPSVEINLFPNPAYDELILNYTGNKPFNIEIINSLGRIQFEKNDLLTDKYVVNTQYYLKGVYYLILFNEKTRLTKKFIKL